MAKQFVCSYDHPIVTTKQGKLRGFETDGTYVFQGIKYADSKRFQMPSDPASWEGVKDAHSYGFVSPMLDRETAVGEIAVPHRYWPKDENCQYLNIWSQSLDENAKKPVMVWLHGGGFSAGSSIEQVAYEGENLSRFGDVVVVTINHRLNILGYLDLSPYSKKYANSGNAGNADLVAALKWIHENIAGFGGDPENVTIFGQSGGGGKVYTLMQTPAADGLFQKAIVMSGVGDGMSIPANADSRPLVDGMLKELGLTAAEIEKLETLPYEALAEAYKKVSPAIREAGGYVGCAPIPNEFYAGDPREVGFTEHAKTIPTVVGTVIAEFGGFAPGLPKKHELTRQQELEILKPKFGTDTEKLIALFEAAFPGKPITDLLVLDGFSREPSKDFCRKKAVSSQSAVYNYLFTYEFPIDDGRAAWHCSDIPFFFHNTDLVPICNIPGVSDQLEDRMAASFVNFARTGVPGCPSLPVWEPCKPDDIATMIFDRECRVVHNLDDELQKAIYPYAQRPDFAQKKEKKDGEQEVVILH